MVVAPLVAVGFILAIPLWPVLVLLSGFGWLLAAALALLLYWESHRYEVLAGLLLLYAALGAWFMRRAARWAGVHDEAVADDQSLSAYVRMLERNHDRRVEAQVQSGDDMILKRMKRRHARTDTIRFCETVRGLRPEAAFGADSPLLPGVERFGTELRRYLVVRAQLGIVADGPLSPSSLVGVAERVFDRGLAAGVLGQWRA